jgi:hypothetical protein
MFDFLFRLYLKFLSSFQPFQNDFWSKGVSWLVLPSIQDYRFGDEREEPSSLQGYQADGKLTQENYRCNMTILRPKVSSRNRRPLLRNGQSWLMGKPGLRGQLVEIGRYIGRGMADMISANANWQKSYGTYFDGQQKVKEILCPIWLHTFESGRRESGKFLFDFKGFERYFHQRKWKWKKNTKQSIISRCKR